MNLKFVIENWFEWETCKVKELWGYFLNIPSAIRHHSLMWHISEMWRILKWQLRFHKKE